MPKVTPTYLLLLPPFMLWHHYNELFGFISFSEAVVYLLLIYLTIAIIGSLLFLICRKPLFTSLLTFGLILFIVYYGAWHDAIKSVFPHSLPGTYIFTIAFTVFILLLLSWFISTKPQAIDNTQKYLNLLMLVLLLVEAGNSGLNLYRLSRTHNLLYTQTPIADQYKPCKLADTAKPDIFFLVFDEYTNDSMLKKRWNFDNGQVSAFLRDQHFYSVTAGQANYNFTPFSVSSTFNMNYIDPSRGWNGMEPVQALQAVRSMSNNETFSLLKRQGYTLHVYAPFQNSIANTGLHPEFAHYGKSKLYNHTLPIRLQQDVLWKYPRIHRLVSSLTKNLHHNPSYEVKKQDISLTIKNIRSSVSQAAGRSPQFVYGHFMVPHKPYLFKADGTPLTLSDKTVSNLTNAYIGQVSFANQIIMELVSYIRQHNKKNTIIIIEGDHGCRDWPDDIQSHFPNFNAIYFPDQNYSALYPTISPVNTFRVTFNQYFCLTLPLLKDTSINVYNLKVSR